MIEQLIPGQHLEERTESALLDYGFDVRFYLHIHPHLSDYHFDKFKLDPIYGLNCTAKNYDKSKFVAEDTKTSAEIDFKKSICSESKKVLTMEEAIASEKLYTAISQLVSDKNMKDYLFSHGFDSEIQRIISTIEKGGYSGEIVKFHEKVEVHEIYRSYKLYCTLKGLSCVSIEDLFNSDGDSVKVFYSSGEYTKAKEEAHKKALVAEHSFIYHTAKKMGYHLNFSALAHAHPLRKRAPKDTEFVLDFFHGYKKEYTDTELADAKRFYEDMGVTGWPSDGKEVKPDFGSDDDTSSSGGSSGLKLSLSYGSSADQRLKSKVKV